MSKALNLRMANRRIEDRRLDRLFADIQAHADFWLDEIEAEYGEIHDMPTREGCKILCEVPQELGPITDMCEVRGKVVLETANGFKFIAPTGRLN